MALESWRRPSGGNMHWFNLKHTLLLSFVAFKVLDWSRSFLPIWSMVSYLLVLASCYWFGFVACRWLKRYKLAFIISSYQKAVFITGCDSSSGNILARRLATERGFQVFAACKDATGAQARKLAELPNIQVVQMNSNNQQECKEALKKVEETLEATQTYLWAVVLIGESCKSVAELEWQDVSSIQEMINTNLLGSIQTIKTFLPNLKKSKGRIVILSNIAGRFSLPGFTAHAMCSAALNSLSEGLRRELHVWDVDVCTVELGNFNCCIDDLVYSEKKFLTDELPMVPERIQDDYGHDYFGYFFKSMKACTRKLYDSFQEKDVIEKMTHAVTTVWPEAVYRSNDWAKQTIYTLLDYVPVEVVDLYFERLLKKNFVPNAVSKT